MPAYLIVNVDVHDTEAYGPWPSTESRDQSLLFLGVT